MTATVELRFTDVGEGLVSGEIVEWLVARGDVVQRDQPLVAVETDKSVVELPSPVAGTVTRLAVAPGATVHVGDLLVVLRADAPSPDGGPGEAPARAAIAEPSPDSDGAATTPGSGRPRARAAPAVRKLAVDLGVDLAAVVPSGPDGRVTSDDVRRQAASPAPETTPTAASSPAPVRVGWAEAGPFPLRGVRKRTAEVMARSWSSIPHITGMDELDATALLDARDRLAALTSGGRRLTLLPLLVKAVAGALRRYPLVNATIDADGAVVVHAGCDVGVAVATGDGLVVPVVTGADAKSVTVVAAEIADLAERARSRRLAPIELTGGTCTVTNYGVFGGRFATPLIRPPEVAIVGFGAVAERPMVVGGHVVARPTLPVCISADHRLIDGDVLGAFTADIAATVAEPFRLLLED